MSGKGAPSTRPKLAGIDYQDVTTAEGDVPATYFAGVRKLPVSWVMQPVISKTKPANTGGKGK